MQVASGNPTVINTIMTTYRGEGVSDGEGGYDRFNAGERILQRTARAVYGTDAI